MPKKIEVLEEEMLHLIKIATRRMKRIDLEDLLMSSVEITEDRVYIGFPLEDGLEEYISLKLEEKDRRKIKDSILEIKRGVKILRNYDIRVV